MSRCDSTRSGASTVRGGSNGPNYAQEFIAQCESALDQIGQTPSIMVDCSHANSNKDHTQQANVLASVADQILAGNQSITGIMIESNIGPGNQKISDSLEYGVSITDACIDWDETESMLTDLASKISPALQARV